MAAALARVRLALSHPLARAPPVIPTALLVRDHRSTSVQPALPTVPFLTMDDVFLPAASHSTLTALHRHVYHAIRPAPHALAPMKMNVCHVLAPVNIYDRALA